jgi:hypothetical protein
MILIVRKIWYVVGPTNALVLVHLLVSPLTSTDETLTLQETAFDADQARNLNNWKKRRPTPAPVAPTPAPVVTMAPNPTKRPKPVGKGSTPAPVAPTPAPIVARTPAPIATRTAKPAKPPTSVGKGKGSTTVPTSPRSTPPPIAPTRTPTVRCKSMQISGGQGLTAFTVDLLRTSGKFPVSYDMHRASDHMFIEYGGTRIFDSGNHVSGSANVTFSGSRTHIEVNVYAPIAGRAWNVYVGCPFHP